MSAWFHSSLGRALLAREREVCAELLPTGYYPRSLQAGSPSIDFLGAVESGARFFCGANVADALQAAGGEEKIHCAVASAPAMPFAERTHDLIILPHTLDFCDEPHAVLREASQILTPRGCLVIIGFNPWSLWGAARLWKSGRGHYRRPGRVQDWLALLGFELAGARMLIYQPPLQSEKWRRKLSFIDKAGERWWPGLGAVYVIIGRKREIARTGRDTARMRWPDLLPGMARPAAQRAGRSAKVASRAHLTRVK